MSQRNTQLHYSVDRPQICGVNDHSCLNQNVPGTRVAPQLPVLSVPCLGSTWYSLDQLFGNCISLTLMLSVDNIANKTNIIQLQKINTEPGLSEILCSNAKSKWCCSLGMIIHSCKQKRTMSMWPKNEGSVRWTIHICSHPTVRITLCSMCFF